MKTPPLPVEPALPRCPGELAEAVREACLQATLAGWEAAGTQGLCAEGRWEVAIGALRSVDLQALVQAFDAASGST